MVISRFEVYIVEYNSFEGYCRYRLGDGKAIFGILKVMRPKPEI